MRKVWLLGKNIKIIYFNTARDNFFTDFRVLLLLSYCTVLYTIICSNKFHKIVGMKLKIHCCLCLNFPPKKYYSIVQWTHLSDFGLFCCSLSSLTHAPLKLPGHQWSAGVALARIHLVLQVPRTDLLRRDHNCKQHKL